MLKRLLLITGVCLPLLLVPTAGAQTIDPSGVQGAAVTASPVDSAGTITCTADGFKPGTTVSCTIASTPTLLGTATAGTNGRASLTAALPGDITPGTHTVTAAGTGANGQPLSISTQVQISQTAAANAARNAGLAPVTPSSPGSLLARTGRNYGGLIKVGVLLLAVGVGAVLFTRKRRAQV